MAKKKFSPFVAYVDTKAVLGHFFQVQYNPESEHVYRVLSNVPCILCTFTLMCPMARRGDFLDFLVFLSFLQRKNLLNAPVRVSEPMSKVAKRLPWKFQSEVNF